MKIDVNISRYSLPLWAYDIEDLICLSIMLLKDHFDIFRKKCFVWRREKWYYFHLHIFTVLKVVMIYFFLRISKATQFKIPFTFNLNLEFDVIYFPCFIITFLSITKELDELHKFMMDNFEDYESRGEEVYQRLLKLTGYLQWLTYTSDFMAFIFMAALIYSESQHNTFLYIFVLFQDFYQNPVLYWSFIISYYLFAFYNLRIGYGTLYLFFHLMLHYILQFILLKEGVKALQNYSGNDEASQHKVKIELKRLAKHSQILTRFHNEVMHILRLPTLVMLCIIVSSVTVGYFTTFFIRYYSEYIFIFVICILMTGSMTMLIYMGQIYCDQTGDFCDGLYKCPWYEWSSENKKSYQIILIFYAEREDMLYVGLVPIIHESIILIGRRLFAALTFASTVSDRFSQ